VAKPSNSFPNGDQAAAQPAGAIASSAKKVVRRRVARSFPAASFMEALPLADAIQRFAAGQRIRRLTLFENLDRSPESGPSRQLITNSNQYGLTTGGYSAEYLELTPEGRLASGTDVSERARLAARLQLAVERVDPFRQLYERFSGDRLPSPTVLRDAALEFGVADQLADECVQTFLANVRDLGVLRSYAGAERLLTFDMALDEAAGGGDRSIPVQKAQPPIRRKDGSDAVAAVMAEAVDLASVCFFVSPIGTADSEHRRHADLVMGSLVEPAITSLDLRLVRADLISQPGVISSQIIDHIVRAPLVIADLSFGNPNVFYELALRHATRRPVVQLIRSADPLPFDVGQFRTVVIDMTDIYSLVPQIDTYRAEIARQCRAALEEGDPAQTPLALFYPQFWESFRDTGGG
jgi:hypothetical protein